jgi:hypothetical protein
MTNFSTAEGPSPGKANSPAISILMLGPDAVTVLRQWQRVSLQTLLLEHLTSLLKDRAPQHMLPAQPSLTYVAKTLEDAIFVQEKSALQYS